MRSETCSAGDYGTGCVEVERWRKKRTEKRCSCWVAGTASGFLGSVDQRPSNSLWYALVLFLGPQLLGALIGFINILWIFFGFHVWSSARHSPTKAKEAKEAKRHPTEAVPPGRADGSTALVVSSYHDLISLDSPGSVLLMIRLYLMYTYIIIFIYIYIIYTHT